MAWHAPCGGGIGQGDMYHILAAQRHRQDGASLREKPSPGAPRRRRPARPGRAACGRPRRHRRRGSADATLPCRAAVSTRSAPLISVPPRPPGRAGRAPAGAAPVSIRSPRSAGTSSVAGLEGAGQRALQLALGIGLVERARPTPIQAPRPGARARTSGATWPSGPSASRISSSRGAVRRVRMQRALRETPAL